MDTNNLSGVKIAFALTGSFCTFSTAIEQMKKLSELKAEVIPIMIDVTKHTTVLQTLC